MRKESSVLKNIGKRRQNNIGKLGQIKMLEKNPNILISTVNVNGAKLSNQIKEKEYRHIRKSRGTRVQIANICWIIEKAREFQKNIYLFIDYARSQQTVENSERDGIPDHLTCLLRNLYAGKEATVRTIHATADWFKIGKRVHQGYILSPCLFNLYAEDIM